MTRYRCLILWELVVMSEERLGCRVPPWTNPDIIVAGEQKAAKSHFYYCVFILSWCYNCSHKNFWFNWTSSFRVIETSQFPHNIKKKWVSRFLFSINLQLLENKNLLSTYPLKRVKKSNLLYFIISWYKAIIVYFKYTCPP